MPGPFTSRSRALHAMARAGGAPRPPINVLGDYAGGGLMGAFGAPPARTPSAPPPGTVPFTDVAARWMTSDAPRPAASA